MKKKNTRLLSPITRGSATHGTVPLSSLLSVRPRGWDQQVELANLQYVENVREKYREQGWKWGHGPEYLYAQLIQALDLGAYEQVLIAAARKRGRPQDVELGLRINWEAAHGKTTPQIQQTLANEDIHLSREAIEAYLKTRWKTRNL